MIEFLSVTGHDPVTKQKTTIKVNPRFIVSINEETGEVMGTRYLPRRFCVGDTVHLLNPNIYPDRVPEVPPGGRGDATGTIFP